MTTVLDQPPTAQRRASPWLPILSAIWPAGLLLFAAAMKWKQLPIIERMGNDLLHNPWIAAAQILFESALALWLLADAIEVSRAIAFGSFVARADPGRSTAVAAEPRPLAKCDGLWTAWSRPVTLAAFALFACVTAYRGIAGEPSCGCFGEFKVNPWITFALDLSVIALLLACLRPKSRPLTTENTDDTENAEALLPSVYSVYSVVKKSSAVAAMLIVVALTLWRMPSVSAADLSTGIVRSGNLLILEPERWAGKPLPILPYLEPPDPPAAALDQLTAGRWRLIIYNSDCDHCRQSLPILLHAIASNPQQAQRYCFVQVPSDASEGEELVPSDRYGLRARLTPREEWFASTPIIVELNDGIVQRAAEGKAAENLDLWFGTTADSPRAEFAEHAEMSICLPLRALCALRARPVFRSAKKSVKIRENLRITMSFLCTCEGVMQ